MAQADREAGEWVAREKATQCFAGAWVLMQTLKLCAKCAEKLSRGYAVNKEPATSAKGKCAECGKTGYMSEYTVTKK